MELERQPIGRDGAPEVETYRSEGYPQFTGESRHSATPGTTYGYRLRIDDAETSEEVRVRVAEPKGPPPVPADVVAQAAGPYAVSIRWKADERPVTGFVVELKRDDAFILAAVLDPTAHELVHNYRLPGARHEYRVAAFNARGKSDYVAVSGGSAAAHPKPRGDRPPSPCTSVPARGRIEKIEPAPGLSFWTDKDETAGGAYTLYGVYQGCVRELGRLFADSPIIARPATSEGFPLLRAGYGDLASDPMVVRTFAFANHRYDMVNEATFCGAPPAPTTRPDPTSPHIGKDDDLTKWSGPFPDCQRDFRNE